jgi:hypothetical protein
VSVFLQQRGFGLQTSSMGSVSCQGLKAQLDESIRDDVVAVINNILEEEKTETEAVYRALVGLGNIVHAFSSSSNSVLQLKYPPLPYDRPTRLKHKTPLSLHSKQVIYNGACWHFPSDLPIRE